MYKYFLFDLDRTLWSFDKNAKSAIFHLIDKYGLLSLFGVTDKELFFSRYEELNHTLWAKYEAGEITKDYLRWARFEIVFKEYLEGIKFTPNSTNIAIKASEWSQETLHKFSEEFAEAYLNQMTYETALEPHAEEVLKRIKDQGGKIAIITNGFKDVQYRKLRNSNIIHYMDAIIISEEVGVHKPNPIIFIKALEALCTNGEYDTNRANVKKATLMIGDDFTNDIEGAQVFGIDQFYYNPLRKPCDGGPTYESHTLKEILKVSSLL